jgi:hypothetical protein
MAPEIDRCIKEIKRWEDMKDRHEPVTTNMIHYQKTVADSTPIHSIDHAMFDCGWHAAFIPAFDSPSGPRMTMCATWTMSSKTLMVPPLPS